MHNKLKIADCKMVDDPRKRMFLTTSDMVESVKDGSSEQKCQNLVSDITLIEVSHIRPLSGFS